MGARVCGVTARRERRGSCRECEATCSNISQSRAQLSGRGENDFRLRYSAVAFGERLAPTRVRFIHFVLPAVYFVVCFLLFFLSSPSRLLSLCA